MSTPVIETGIGSVKISVFATRRQKKNEMT